MPITNDMNPSPNHIGTNTSDNTRDGLQSGSPASAGKVIFIGAGPGDPELLTIKALRWLQRADVVIADRLVSPEILREYTTPSALIIPVGKQCHSDASTPQSAINDLLVEHAGEDRLVIRLKGGD